MISHPECDGQILEREKLLEVRRFLIRRSSQTRLPKDEANGSIVVSSGSRLRRCVILLCTRSAMRSD